LARGLKLKEVAIELGLSVRTVETYQMRARRKLGLRNKAQITRFAYENKLIQGYD
jgi:DNA-binding CsgD family transcriptional regulator